VSEEGALSGVFRSWLECEGDCEALGVEGADLAGVLETSSEVVAEVDDDEREGLSEVTES
jgi:hypothetical protein